MSNGDRFSVYINETPEEEQEISTFHRLDENSISKKYYSKYYTPLVVSIGPHHTVEEHVAAMVKFKKKAVRELAERAEVSTEQLFASIEEDLLNARMRLHLLPRDDGYHYFADMVLDGCFIIEFIHKERMMITTRGSRRRRRYDINKHDEDLVRRDLLLFENQVPFLFLEALAREFRLDLVDMVTFWSLQMPLLNISSAPTSRFPDYYKGGQPQAPPAPVHLLQFYRDLWIKILFGDDDVVEQEEDNIEEEEEGEEDDDDLAVCPPFSVTELKKAGIRCSHVSGRRPILLLSDIHLESSMLSGKLFLPQLTICESTMALFLNLVAYEKSSKLLDKSIGITSYLSFMRMLINGEEDVKELRARGVIQLIKVGDDQVANFFKDIPAYNPRAFSHVNRQISTYFKTKRLPLNVTYAALKQRYFSGPWSFLVFLAVVFTVGMTVIQTVFTGIQTYKKK